MSKVALIGRRSISLSKYRRTAFGIFCVFIARVCLSMVVPFMSIYIVEELQEPPFIAGLVASLTILITVATNTVCGKKMDASGSFGLWLLFTAICYASGAILNMVIESSFAKLSMSVLLFGLAGAATGAAYSLAKACSDSENIDSSRASALFRIATSAAWPVGPLIVFTLYGSLGTTYVFLAVLSNAAILFVLAFISLGWGLDWAAAEVTAINKSKYDYSKLLPLLVICGAFSFANVLTTSSIPLYMVRELNINAELVGSYFGAKTISEIASISLVGYLGGRIPVTRWMMSSAIVGVFAYGLLASTSSYPILISSAVLEGVFYGIFAASSLAFIQESDKKRLGQLTSYYINSLLIGSLIGVLFSGLVAQLNSYRAAILCASIMMTLTSIYLLYVFTRRPDRNA